MTDIECVRCSALTEDQTRCKRETCKYPVKCWQHTRLLDHLVVKQSGIPGAGMGLYTTVPLRSGDFITMYSGRLQRHADYDQTDGEYGVHLNNEYVINSTSSQDALGRYINDCRAANKRQRHCGGKNARFVVNNRNNTIRVVATKRIPAGSEIFLSYGVDYWNAVNRQ